MKRLTTCLLLCGTAMMHQVFADDNSPVPAVINKNASYINTQAYLQNPFGGLPSGGGTQTVSESEIASQNMAQQLFEDGTWNVWGTASIGNNFNGVTQPGLEYGASIFGQTGQVAGFSVGGLLNVINPFGSSQGLGSYSSNQFLTSGQQIMPLEGFVEYQASNILNIDAGWIGINNSPWLGTNYYNDQTSAFNYQGVLINLNPGGGWLLTALAFNAAIATGNTSFTQQTLYNPGFNWSQSVNNPDSPYTAALGASYYSPSNNYNLRLWAYQFANYANLLYADNTLNFPVSKNLSFQLQGQAGTETGSDSISIGNQYSGSASSNFIGAQGGVTYEWFGLNVSYNDVWGPQNSFGSGGIVSPYTYNDNVDPLYSDPWMAGLVTKGSAGSAYKIAPSINLLNGALTIAPAYAYIDAVAAPSNSEYDFLVTYNVPQVKGLQIFGVVAYSDSPLGTNQPSATVINGYTSEFMVSYLY